MELQAVFHYDRPETGIAVNGETEKIIRVFEVMAPVNIDIEDVEMYSSASNGHVSDDGVVDMKFSNIYTKAGHVITINMPYHKLKPILEKEKQYLKKKKLLTQDN